MNLSWKTRVASGAALSYLLVASGCGTGTTEPSPEEQGDGDGALPNGNDPVLNGFEGSHASLDLSAIGTQSANWCQMPTLTPAGFVPLTKQALAETLAEYTVGWMTPLHDGIGSLKEQSLFNTTFEMIWATFDTSCNWNTEEDLTFGDDGLLDEENRADAYQEVFDFIQAGTEVQAGEVLRLSMHDCPTCAEPLGAQPFYVNAQQTSDGVLVLSVEPFEGSPSQTYYITPELIVAQADLSSLSEWLQQVDSDARSGEVLWPDAGGTVTAIALRTPEGLWSSVGLSDVSFDSQIESEDNVHVSVATPCIGMHATTHHPTTFARASAVLGDLQVVVPGSLHCQSDDCGVPETTQDWVYALDGFALSVDQPDLTSEKELEVWMSADSSAAALLGTETFASWQVGSEQVAERGAFQASVDEGPDGFLVTFEPALNMRGAMAISKFSDQFRLSLPTWLEDEIFDLNFGGDPTASVLVPYREQCNDDDENPEGQDPPEPERREIRIVSGTVSAEVGSGTKTATAGQCAGATLRDESELTLTSDWAELGFVCQ